MKKRMALLAVCCGVSGAAYAQSSVTLYGVIDEGFDYTNNVGGNAAYQLESGYAQGTRFGFKGSEDLGGGLKAIFQLENGFNVNSGKLGQGGLLFGRQAFVGLSSDKAGSVTFGRQYDSIVDYLAPLTANGNWAGFAFSHPYDNDNTDNSFRINNSVKYTNATIGGLRFGGLYGFSNTAGGFANDRTYSFGAQYSNGPITVAAAYMLIDNPGATSGGSLTSTDVNFIASRQQVYGAGVNYSIGPATLGFVYTNTDLTNPSSTEYLGSIEPAAGSLSSLKFNNFEVNAKYQVTPAFFVGGEYVYTTAKFDATSGNLSPKYQTIGLMTDYFLSKRTDIYLQGVYEKAGGDKTGTALDLGSATGSTGPSSTNNQLLVRVALRHKF
jgi:predicted porin